MAQHIPSTDQGAGGDDIRAQWDLVFTALEHTRALVVVLDREGRIHLFNRACEQLSGYRFEEVAGTFPWECLIPPEEADAVRVQAFEALARHPQSLTAHYTNHWQSKSGQRYLIDWHNSLLLDADGRMHYMLAIGIDVSDRQALEIALKRSEEIYQRAEAMAHVGTWDWNILTGDLYWTDEIYRIFGQTPRSFGATYQAFLAAVHPEDRDKVTAAVNASVADATVPYDIEHRVLRPCGDIRHVRERGELFRDHNGKPLRMIGTVLDITEMKRVELELRRHQEHLEELVAERAAKLQESESQLRRAQQIAHLGHWSVNVQTGELMWSDEIYRIFGREPQSFAPSQERFFAAVHPDDVAHILNMQEEAFARGGVFRIDHRIVLPDGSVRWVHEEAITEMDAGGRPWRLTGTVQDITERKAIEAELMRARDEIERQGRRNEVILATMLDGFFVGDVHGNLIDVNPAFMELLGYSRDEMLTLKIEDIEAKESPAEVAAHQQRLLAQRYDRFESQHRRKGGGIVDVEISVMITEIEGEPFTFAIVRDISNRRRAERELLLAKEELERQSRRNESILATTLDGFVLVNLQGRIQDANPAFLDMLGYSRAEMLDLSIADIDAEMSQEQIKQHMERIMNRGYDRFETRERRKDGNIIDVEISAAVADIGGETLLFAFQRDITARRQAERELLLAKEEAERANKAKSEFLSRMSHELRTPLNAILGFAQVLEMQALPAEQQDYVDEIAHAGKHLLQLINELLDLSRIETGNLAVAITPVAVRQALQQALAIVQSQIDAQQLSVTVDCGDVLSVLADPTRLKQVLVNLLNNAAKYNRVGGSIGVECRPRPNHRLRIRVTDTGQGIGAAHLGKLFVPFERLGVEKRGIDGTGIGLALCKQMVEMMGGEIGVDSHEGVGSTFWIELPASDELSEPPTRNGVARLEAQQRVHTVVYVEDNPTNLRLVQSLFRHYPQLALTAASTGEQGLALIERIQPDLVVLDIHLPGIDGYGVLQAMREHPSLRHIPAIALSADAMPDDIERGLRAGFRRYLTKPLNMEQFMQAIAELTTGAD